MPPATASATASAFRKKPVVEIPPTAWSGRLAPDELRRPGGMLIAALVQCASEQGLTLQQMAQEMGVSYWDVSQLRIGLRRMDGLDDEFAAASARFLNLPHQTVAMLAGLLEPREALEAHALTAEDIVHALHLMATAPSDVELATQLNPNRPLQAFSVDELADLQRQYGPNPAVREALRAELRNRPPSKTELLRRAVDGDAHPETTAPPKAASAPPASAIMRCASCQTRLRIPHLSEPGEIRCPACRAEYQVQWDAAVCVVLQQALAEEEPAQDDEDEPGPQATAPHAPDDDPWAVLGLARNSPWDDVERARRSLLQQYHPDRLGQVSPLVRKLAENAFKRVSDAYGELKARR